MAILARGRLQPGFEDNWSRLLHLGVMEYWAGNLPAARKAWERSLEMVETPWAARNLGVLAWKQGWLDEAAELIIRALRMAPDLLPLAIESGQYLLEDGRVCTAFRLFESSCQRSLSTS